MKEYDKVVKGVKELLKDGNGIIVTNGKIYNILDKQIPIHKIVKSLIKLEEKKMLKRFGRGKYQTNGFSWDSPLHEIIERASINQRNNFERSYTVDEPILRYFKD